MSMKIERKKVKNNVKKKREESKRDKITIKQYTQQQQPKSFL